MRCGVETQGKQVFCVDCLATMEKYPINPGTAVYLPIRESGDDSKKNPKKKPELTPEEQIHRLKRQIRHLALCLLAAVLAVAVLTAVVIYQAQQKQSPGFNSRNYTSQSTGMFHVKHSPVHVFHVKHD